MKNRYSEYLADEVKKGNMSLAEEECYKSENKTMKASGLAGVFTHSEK